MTEKAETRSITELLQLGEMGLELAEWEQAKAYFDLVLERAPGHPEALLGKATACRDPSEALDLVREVLQVRPASHKARRLQAQLLEKAGARDKTPSTEPAVPPVRLPEVAEDEEKALPDLTQYTNPRPSSTPPPSGGITITSGLVDTGDEKGSPSPIPALGSKAVQLIAFIWKNRSLRRRISLFYFLANLIVAGLVAAVTLPRILSVTDQIMDSGLLQELSDESTPAVELTAVQPTHIPGVLEKAELATVLIIVPNPTSGEVSRGSGSVVDADGLVLTNYHVMANPERTALANQEGLAFVGFTKDVRQSPSEWYIGAQVASDTNRDLSVLKILYTSEGRSVRGHHFPPIPLGDSGELELGQTLMGLGYPSLGGETLTLTRGSMAGFSSSLQDLHLGKTDSELLPGSSGGAVLNDEGRLVGVITAAHTDYRTQGRLSYFVLFHEAEDIIEQAKSASRPRAHVQWMVDLFDDLIE